MADDRKAGPLPGWRISKACQECRKRKIKCDGGNPCKTCRERSTSCVYRDVIRQRRKKQQQQQQQQENRDSNPHWGSAEESDIGRPLSPGSSQGAGSAGRRNEPVMYTFHNSVSATHMASPSCKVQLYYGPTSHFSLLQHIYRDLVSVPNLPPTEPQGEVEHADAGLDLFNFRRIFFGSLAETHDVSKDASMGNTPLMFLPREVAMFFLERYLATFYYLTPFWPKETIRRDAERLYDPDIGLQMDPSVKSVILMAMACGALGTEHYAWGEVLYERVKASSNSLDDVVNLQTVQTSLLMAHYQADQGRPNSSFLHLGVATRKAFAAGLHKDAPDNERDADRETVERRRTTFWSLYFYENLLCFHMGRPSSLTADDIGTVYPEDPFLLALIHLSKAISRSAKEIYGKRHQSLLQMWKVALSISDGLSGYECRMRKAVGFGLEKTPQPGHIGVQQTVLALCYYYTLLLTFRPFLIFRGRWRQSMKTSAQAPAGNDNRPHEIPSWLNEACDYVLYTARKTIHYLCKASLVNELVRELRYHTFFLSSATFTIIYDALHDEKAATTHLPWAHAALQCLSTMRPGDSVSTSISGLQSVLQQMNFPLDLTAEQQVDGDSGNRWHYASQGTRGYDQTGNSMMPIIPEASSDTVGLTPRNLPVGDNITVNGFNKSMDNNGTAEDLLDLTEADMGWGFDFSTMDLEGFFSIYPTVDTTVPSF
ncbi:transcriptional regulator family: Fungal Specific TF [Paecilomyces variotii]|nr:transcriptional regulator family: Fungal Specific TF [Paecilomyces variotii]KAJ9327535.1 transcriptional regulator family: Fungal Specific TF [Paecilomyces variotii]KAJ9336242.1 transcriptional regulator family: Fungal Specific TF [Paecilomyces variotii]